MAMILTTPYVREGATAWVLLCDDAAELALQDADAGSDVVPPADASPRQMLKGLAQAGVEVQVCATSLSDRADTEDNLRQGITVVPPDAIARAMAGRESKAVGR